MGLRLIDLLQAWDIKSMHHVLCALDHVYIYNTYILMFSTELLFVIFDC